MILFGPDVHKGRRKTNFLVHGKGIREYGRMMMSWDWVSCVVEVTLNRIMNFRFSPCSPVSSPPMSCLSWNIWKICCPSSSVHIAPRIDEIIINLFSKILRSWGHTVQLIPNFNIIISDLVRPLQAGSQHHLAGHCSHVSVLCGSLDWPEIIQKLAERVFLDGPKQTCYPWKKYSHNHRQLGFNG